MKLAPWLAILVLSPLLAQAQGRDRVAARLDPNDLAPGRNQVSNPSFEAPTTGLPPSYVALSGDAAFGLSRGQALHGEMSLGVHVPATASGPAVLAQLAPGCGRCTYQLEGWVRHGSGPGEVRLALEMLGRQQQVLGRQESEAMGEGGADWRPLTVQLQAPPETEWVRLAVTATPGAVAQVDALRLAIVAGPRRRSYGPHVWDLHLTRTEATWVAVQWAGAVGTYEVSYREPRWPRKRHVALEGIHDLWYSLVGLTPETTYEMRVRLLWPQHYDEQGRAVAAPAQPAASEPLSLTTKPWEYREVGQLRIWPFAPLSLAEGMGHNPRLEAGKGHLYLAQEHGGGIALSKLAPDPLAAVWTKQIVPAPAEGLPPVLLDTQLQGETLFVLTQRGPDELFLLSFSIESEAAEPAVTLRPATAPARLGRAGLASFRNELWLLWVEETGADDELRGLLRLGVLAGDRLTKTVAWSDAAVLHPGEASVSSFGDELLIPCCDTLGEGPRPGFQALDVVAFDGLSFEGLRKLRDMGRSREPRGRQFGPNFYLVFTSDANYLGLEGRYRDLMLATLPPGRLGLEMVNLLDDQKCNLAPDIAALGDSLWTVHEKLERAPTVATPEPRNLGVFVGRIDFGPIRRTAPPRSRGGARPARPAPALPPVSP